MVACLIQQLHTHYGSTSVHIYVDMCVCLHAWIYSVPIWVDAVMLVQLGSCLMFVWHMCGVGSIDKCLQSVAGVDWSPTGPCLACGKHCMRFWFDVCTCHTHYVARQAHFIYIFFLLKLVPKAAERFGDWKFAVNYNCLDLKIWHRFWILDFVLNKDDFGSEFLNEFLIFSPKLKFEIHVKY